ncbi:hypothetical protein, partial [Actinomadura sp. GC306]|uniref:hypothetical protein n=1 Tax=Actinomadura sp. GC306 TaxID=2530367 RepID=UPI001FB795DB
MASVGVCGDVDVGGVGGFVAVVEGAGEGEVVDVGAAAVQGPAGDVVNFAECAGDLAALDCAGGVEGLEYLALGGGGEPDGAPQVERQVAVPQEKGRHPGVEGDAAG